MEQILNTQLFGLVTIILFYNIGLFIQKKARNPICNGLLISIILIIVFLKEKFVKILCTKRRKDWTNPAEAVSIKGKNKKGDTSDGISNEGIRRGTAARDDGNMERRR